VYLLVPETKGKSSEEIQKLFLTVKEEPAQPDSQPTNDGKTEDSNDDGVDNPSFVKQEEATLP